MKLFKQIIIALCITVSFSISLDALRKVPSYEHILREEEALRARVEKLTQRSGIDHEVAKMLYLSVHVSHAGMLAKLSAARTPLQRAAELQILKHKITIAQDALGLIPLALRGDHEMATEMVARLTDVVSRAMNAATAPAAYAARKALDQDRALLARYLKKAEPQLYRRLVKHTIAAVEQRVRTVWEYLLYALSVGRDDTSTLLEKLSFEKEWQTLCDLGDDAIAGKIATFAQQADALATQLSEWNRVRMSIFDGSVGEVICKPWSRPEQIWPRGLQDRVDEVYDYVALLCQVAHELTLLERGGSRKACQHLATQLERLFEHDRVRFQKRYERVCVRFGL